MADVTQLLDRQSQLSVAATSAGVGGEFQCQTLDVAKVGHAL